MQAEVRSNEDWLVTEFAKQVNRTTDEPAARSEYRHAFNRLRSHLVMYPCTAPTASAVFESAATTVRMLAAHCLPLAIAVAMHLYPLCALQCIPLPLVSPARFKRAMLLRTIRSRSLILANAGSERTQAADQPLVATPAADGILINGTYEYMSLASVADIVLFKAKLIDRDCSALCAADLRAGSVRIGRWKFSGNMRLSDTSSVSFTNHRVPHGRYLLVPDSGAGLQCTSDYQRCWFHLFVAEMYLARLERLQRVWELPRTADLVVSLNEVFQLREYSLRLLDDFSSNPDIEPLTKTTGALKLRVSLLAQLTATALRSRGTQSAEDALTLAADASELCHIKSQPTADEKILRSLGVP